MALSVEENDTISESSEKEENEHAVQIARNFDLDNKEDGHSR